MTASRGMRAFLVGYYGMDNLGDEAIRAAIERRAAELGVTLVAVAIRPGRPPRAGEVRLDLRGARGYFRAILAADRVALGGGGILKDEGLRLIVDLAVTAVAARLLRRRVTLLAVGVGPLYTALGRHLVRLVARLADVRTVRDEASARVLRELGVARVTIGADPVFADGQGRAGAAGAWAAAPPGGRALVAIRPWFVKARGRERQQAAFLDRLAAGLRPLVDAGQALELAALYWPRDRDEAAALRERLPMDAAASVIERRLAWDDLRAAAASADIVIAMRYHALAAAALGGRPAIALAYEPKVDALAAELGVPALPVDDPQLGSALAAALGAWVRSAAGRSDVTAPPRLAPARPDPGRIAALRDRARSAVEAALLG